MRLKTMEYLATSTITLTSLAQLLGKISNMVINDHIQQQIEQALGSIHQVSQSTWMRELALWQLFLKFIDYVDLDKKGSRAE